MSSAEGFEVLFRAQYPKLVAIAVSLTGDVDIAADLAQETLARAHADFDRVRRLDSPPAWLRTVLRNLVVDHFRSRESDRSKRSRSAAERRVGSVATVADVDAATSMADLLAILPERQRLMVVLRYVDDLPVAEIASVLGVAAGTVKATLWTARRRLERHLATEGADER